MIQMPSFEQGPFGVSERRLIAPPVGLYIPPGVRLYRESATRLQWRPMSGNAVSGYPDMGMREVVVWWRGMPIVMEPKPPAAFANTKETRFTLDTDDNLLGSTGGRLSTAMVASTLYYVYVNPDGVVRASATAPLYSYDGVRVLNTVLGARDWLFIGYARTDGVPNFVDTTTDRLVANWFNRLRKSIELRPNYNDNNATTTYSVGGATFGRVNAGTGDTGSYISNGEDSVSFVFNYFFTPAVSQTGAVGIGDNSLTSASPVGASEIATQAVGGSIGLKITPAEGYRTVAMLAWTTSGTMTVRADHGRHGSTADEAATCLYGEVVT